MRLDRSERPARPVRDLLEAQFAEEAQRDDLTIGLIELADRGADARGALDPERGDGRVRSAGQVDTGLRAGRVDPGDVPTTLDAPQRDADGDPGQPGTERPLAAPGRQAPKRDHERLLGCVLGLVEVTEDPMTGSQDRLTLVFDEEPERIAVTGQDGIDSGAIIGDLGADERRSDGW